MMRNSKMPAPITMALVATICWCATLVAAFTQDAVPVEILNRTIFIKVGNEQGSAFTIDHLGKLYLITARHVVSGVPENNAVIQVRRGVKWEDYHTIRTLYPVSKDADIAVFETDEKSPQPFKITPMGKTDGVTFGQQLWFIGYPFGLRSLLNADKGTAFPFMKRGTMSAVDSSNPDAVVLYIDGFNNPGFSGGPIVFWNFTSHVYQILGVVKGYEEDTAKVVVNGQHLGSGPIKVLARAEIG